MHFLQLWIHLSWFFVYCFFFFLWKLTSWCILPKWICMSFYNKFNIFHMFQAIYICKFPFFSQNRFKYWRTDSFCGCFFFYFFILVKFLYSKHCSLYFWLFMVFIGLYPGLITIKFYFSDPNFTVFGFEQQYIILCLELV